MAIDELRFKGLEIVRNRGMLSFPCYMLMSIKTGAEI